MYASGTQKEGTQFRIPGMLRLAKAGSVWKSLLPACSNPDCTTRSLRQAMSRRHSTVLMADVPFCTPECFEEGARVKLEGLLRSRHTQEPAPRLRMPLGLVLLSRNVLTPDQLKIALEDQPRSGQNIGEIVQRLGFATPEQVTAAVAAQWACPIFPLSDRTVIPQLDIPRRLLETYKMLPVHFVTKGRKLMIGFVTRVQYHILETIGHITSSVVTPCFITARDYHQGLYSPFAVEQGNEIIFDRVDGPSEMANVACNYVKQLRATRTRLGICRDYLWMRMWGKQQMDILFRLRPEEDH